MGSRRTCSREGGCCCQLQNIQSKAKDFAHLLVTVCYQCFKLDWDQLVQADNTNNTVQLVISDPPTLKYRTPLKSLIVAALCPYTTPCSLGQLVCCCDTCNDFVQGTASCVCTKQTLLGCKQVFFVESVTVTATGSAQVQELVCLCSSVSMQSCYHCISAAFHS